MVANGELESQSEVIQVLGIYSHLMICLISIEVIQVFVFTLM